MRIEQAKPITAKAMVKNPSVFALNISRKAPENALKRRAGTLFSLIATHTVRASGSMADAAPILINPPLVF